MPPLDIEGDDDGVYADDIDRENIYTYSSVEERDQIEADEVEEQDRRHALNPLVMIGNGCRAVESVDDWASDPEIAAKEKELEAMYAAVLESRGEVVRRQVRTAAGIADIVTDDAVIEVKLNLTRAALFSAVGQVTVYAAELGRPRRVVFGYRVPGTEKLIDAIRLAGIEVEG
jgi:hypothetical protein